MTKKLKLEYLKPSDLKPYKNNARVHSEDQIKRIAKSIQDNGFKSPVMIDEKNMILAGHGRVSAAKLLKMNEIPCVRDDSMTTAQKKKFILADNRLAELSEWDDEKLRKELNEILEIDTDMDLSDIGFDDFVLDPAAFEPGDEEDQGKLDTKITVTVKCPSCKHEFQTSKPKS